MKFTKHAYHRKKRLNPRWRRPRGLHNKQRLEIKGATPRVKVGYRTNKASRATKRGLEIVRVYNAADVEAVDAKTQGVVIGKVGTKRKLELLDLIIQKKLILLTGDSQEQRASLQQRYDERRKSREQKRQEREERQEELEKEATKSAESEEEKTPLAKIKGSWSKHNKKT
jgi:ribosomal protein L32E